MIVAVDTGGTKTLVTSFDSSGQLQKSHKFPTPSDQKLYTKTLINTLYSQYDRADIEAIVIATPGVVKNNVVEWAGSSLPWKNLDLPNELGKHYSCPIWVQNDADLAGLSEANALMKPVPLCLYVTISTGIGSGIIINGRLTPELSSSEAGNIMVEYDGKLRTWESFASGKAIHRVYGKYAYEITSSRAWDRIAHTFCLGFIALIPPLQPDVIIIGGSMGTHFDKYNDTLTKLIDTHLPSPLKRPKLKQASHPQEAVVYGCYYYAVHQISD